MSGSRPVRCAALAAALACVLVACGVSDSGGPERIDVGLGLDDTTTTTSSTSTTSTTIVAQSSTSVQATSTTIVQTEDVYLWFITGGQLSRVSIPLASAALGQVLAALQAGPSTLGPPGAGLRSAVPAAPPLGVKDNGDGTATVDLPMTFFDTIQQPDQVRAIAQIVLTLTSQRGIGSVVFTRDGQLTSVPLGTNEQSEAGRPVSRADYRSLTESAPASTTTTSSTSTTTTTTTSVAASTVAPARVDTTSAAPG